MEIAFDERGLAPCVIQDWASGEVLTLAYMNAEALARTRETGELHLWSRSRDELWHKGATSGNTQAVKALRFDCDGDAVLALVEPAGPACHTGERTCFHNGDLTPMPARGAARPRADHRRAGRAAAEGSYTAELLADPRDGGGEGPGGGRGGRPRRPRGERRARGRGGRRRPLPPRRAAALARPQPCRRRGGARLPGVAESTAQPRPGLRDVHRGLRDARLGVPEAARVPARRSCSSPPSRASASAAGRSSATSRAA